MAALLKGVMKYSQRWAAAALCLVAAAPFATNTLMLNYYKSVTQQLRNGKPEDIDPELENLIDQVNFKIKFKPEKEANIDVFTCFNHDPIHKGALTLRLGALIGLPGSFKYSKEEEIVKENLKVNRIAVDWTSPVGKQLANSLLLSDNAKKFAYAREVSYVDSSYVHVDMLFRMLCGFGAYTTGFNLNRKLKLTATLKIWARGSIYSLIGCAWSLMYIVVKDMHSCSQDNRADKKAANLGKEYAEGGVEYYTKILTRNQSIREIMGREGPSYYTAFGNEVATWRTKAVQLTRRRDNLINLSQTMNQNNS